MVDGLGAPTSRQGPELHGARPATQTTVPKSDPTPAVIAMASAPQNVTRMAPFHTPAPPTPAAMPPRSARNRSDVPETSGINRATGVTTATSKGRAAPTAKLAADASAA